MSGSLLKRTWEAGTKPRVTLLLGIMVSIGWAVVAALWTLGLIAEIIRNPALGVAFKVAFPIVLSFVAVFLLIPLPAQWLMYILLRWDQRRRVESDPES